MMAFSPGLLLSLRASLFGSPRYFLWLGAIPLLIGLLLALWLPRPRSRRAPWLLTLSAVVVLAAGLVLCLVDDPAHPAIRAGFVVLAAMLAACLGTLKLYLQLRDFGPWRALFGVGLLLSLLAVLTALEHHYLQLRFRPQLSRDYQRACFVGAALDHANLHQTNCRGADLTKASLRHAYLNLADMRGASFRDADLRGATLFYTEMKGADLRGADLRDVDVTYTQLEGAFYDKQTRWPEEFEPGERDLILVEP